MDGHIPAVIRPSTIPNVAPGRHIMVLHTGQETTFTIAHPVVLVALYVGSWWHVDLGKQ